MVLERVGEKEIEESEYQLNFQKQSNTILCTKILLRETLTHANLMTTYTLTTYYLVLS